MEEVKARLTVLEAEQGAFMADADRLKVHMDLVTRLNAQLAGDSPEVRANNSINTATHGFSETSPQVRKLSVELQNLEERKNETNAQLLKQNIQLYQQVLSLEQQMDESGKSQLTMRQENEQLRRQVQSLTTLQQTFEAKMNKTTVDLLQKMDAILQESSQMKQRLQSLESETIRTAPHQIDLSLQQNSELGQRLQYSEKQIEQLTLRLKTVENTSNESLETIAELASKLASTEQKFHQSARQISDQMQDTETQVQDSESKINQTLHSALSALRDSHELGELTNQTETHLTQVEREQTKGKLT